MRLKYIFDGFWCWFHLIIRKPLYIYFFFFLMIRRPPSSTLFPHTPLFRFSRAHADAAAVGGPGRVDRVRRAEGAAPVGRCAIGAVVGARVRPAARRDEAARTSTRAARRRSEEHTSELQSQSNLVCRLLLEK